jgi:hypothetical protein
VIQPCAIPGCRIVGRHLPSCEGDCRGCLPRTTDEGMVCDVCTGSAGSRLAHIAELTPDARLVAAGLVRRGAGGGGSGKPGSRSPGNDDALVVLGEIQNALTTIARDIAETRGTQFVPTAFAGLQGPDLLSEAAKWLTRQLTWLKHAVDNQGGPYAASVFAEIRDCASRMRGLVDGPAPQRYLGPCGALVGAEADVNTDGEAFLIERLCDGDVYVRGGSQRGRCRSCGAEVARADREAWLDAEVRSWAYRASEIANAYGVNVKTIRSWADRGHLTQHGQDRDGKPLYNLGDVLDLAATDAARREGDRATRARRMEQRSGGAAA